MRLSGCNYSRLMLRGIDHLYSETNHWEASVAFWEGLGFSFEEQWGSEGHRAGRLRCNEAQVVLAEMDGEPAANVFFAIDSADGFETGSGVPVVTPPEDTHWGTRWLRVRYPHGRTYALEEQTAE